MSCSAIPPNPTSVLHPAEVLRALARPGRVLVVDEAFADAVPGERESLAADRHTPGLLVFRSLTKTWALPGLRAGYALGAPGLLSRLADRRPPWPVEHARCWRRLRPMQRSGRSRPRPTAAAAQAVRPPSVVARTAGRVAGVAVPPAGRPPLSLLLRVPDGGSGSGPHWPTPGASRCGARTRFPASPPTTCGSRSGLPEIAAALIDGLRAVLAPTPGDVLTTAPQCRLSAVRSMSTFRHRRTDPSTIGSAPLPERPSPVNADPTAQRLLLDLAAVDAELTRAAHRRRSLPELAEVAQAEGALLSARDSLVATETAASDLDRDIRKLEAEMIRSAPGRTGTAACSTPGRSLQASNWKTCNMSWPPSSVARRYWRTICLEVMERREATVADVARGRAALGRHRRERLVPTRRRDEALAELGSAEEHGQQERRTLIAELPGTWWRSTSGFRARNGTGAALLREHRCGACRLELDRTAIGRLREAAPDEVLRCEECGVVLVRTSESGL